MQVISLPDALFGPEREDVNIFFYQRESGPDQIKLKINYAQNMLVFMVKGVKELIDESTYYSMNDDQIGLISSGNMLMNERVSLHEEFESLLLFFSNEFLARFLKKYNIVMNEDESDHPLVIALPKDAYLRNFQESMLILRNDFSRENFKLAKTEEVLLYLYEKYPDHIKGFIQKSITKTLNRPLVKVIQNHLFDNLRSEELAFLCNMSLSTFRRRFAEVYDTTPKRYFIAQKMKQAAFLLQNKKRPSEIFHELGYENLSSFSMEFKKHFGVPPTTYRPSV